MAPKTHKQLTVGFIALGCPKNVVDSEKMLAEIAQAGFLITPDPAEADIIVVNTCGFIAPAKDESLDAIREALQYKKAGTAGKVIVAGCLSQRMGTGLLDQLDGIDAVVGLAWRDRIATVLQQTLVSGRPKTYLDEPPPEPPDDRGRLLIGPGHSAYLRISEGCDHRCSFCTIPAIRGPFRSKSKDLVLAEAAELASAGVLELNVIGQDTTSYGRDLKLKNALPQLLTELESIKDVHWIRLLYLYPTGITKTLIETIAGSEKIVHYLDIPLQHVCDDILRAMRRPDTSDRLGKLIEKLRAAMPDIVLRTTLIVGFPGETDRHFEQLLEFVKWARFDALGCFKFYPEPGTPAAEMPGQVNDHKKQRRYEQLMLTQQEIAFAKNRERVGTTVRCLVDSIDLQANGLARHYGQAPEIDGITIVRNCCAAPGQFVDATVVDGRDYDLLAEQI